ncbi:MAG: alpha-2-macroglobulin family protein [Chitinophagaceae bacterium]
MKQFSFVALIAALFSLITMNANSQPPIKNYDAAWKKVEGFVKKGLPASALTEVKNIYTQAKKEKQDAQVIKALIYMTGLQTENRENNEVLAIAEIEKEVPGSKGAVNALLNSLLANLYWSYFQNHRWQFYQRTQTAEFKKDDIATWTAEDFHQKTSELYLRSIADKKLLQQTSLESYNAIIIKGNVRHLRPTLYDLLAFQALEYFESDERDLNRPAYTFEIDQAAAFDPAADFIHRKFETKDSLSLQYKALLIYQQLIAFHLDDKKPDALIDADLRRYEFVRQKSVHPNKEEYYFNGINHIAHQYESTPAAAQAWYLVAQYHASQGYQYAPYGDTTYRFSKLRAKEICEKVVAQKDSSEGKINAYNLLQQLKNPSLQFTIEQVNLPDQPFRALIDYRNLTTLHLRLIKSDDKLRKALENQYDESYWKTVIAAKPLRNWEQPLPDTKDLQQHKAEIKIDGLPSGEYFLIAASDEAFEKTGTLIGARRFYVSSISYINNQLDYFVLHRDNGQPLSNSTIQVWEQVYDYASSRNIKTKGAVYTTDKNGYFHLVRKGKQDNNNMGRYAYSLEITSGNEKLHIDELRNDYYYRDNPLPRNENNIFLFKDRSIYRPGQTVYFKGIVLSRNQFLRKADILQGYATIVYLRNANGETIDSLKLTTNDYGSFTGRFQLPATGLNGTYTIFTKKDQGNSYFRVEDYKRPRFYVEYEPLKGTYRVNDSIEVTGLAKAYAGNNIDGAKVKYRVVRQARFLYPWLFARWWQPPSEPLEIVHGETVTDADGKFRVKFAAIPDLKIDPKLEPAFDYVVYADITDINGETRSGEKNVSVSYKALLLKTDIPSRIAADSLNKLSIRTENNNGEFEPATVTVKITKLKEEKRLIRARLWERPDQFVMNKEEYIQYFPHDEYNDETNPASWDKENILWQKTDSVKEGMSFPVSGIKPNLGYYSVEIFTKDKNGAEVKDLKYIELFDEKSKQLGQPQYVWTQGPRPIQPGENTTLRLGTSANDVFIVQQLDKTLPGKDSADINYSFLKLNNEKKDITLSATEAERGGYGVSWAFVKHNRSYFNYVVVPVPWSNKELQIEYATYRDKTLPGSDEKWKLKISGYKNEKVAAEILASMYDASLDQFSEHTWDKPYIWTSYNQRRLWENRQNFIRIESFQRPVSYTTKDLIKDYDRLFFAQSDIVTVGYGVRRKMRALAATPSIALEGKAAGIMVDSAVQADDGVMKYSVAASSRDEEENGETGKDAANPATQIRTNFNETAFFFPDLRTDSNGDIEFSFTMPEALTKWKFQALAHTKDLAFGYSQKEIVTQKQLMVQPNPPRFLREGDQLVFNAKIVNLSEKQLSGNAELQLFNAATNEPVNTIFNNKESSKSFQVAAGQSTIVLFPLSIPSSFTEPLTWRVVAKADNFSDGEENNLPVLSNRMLVTETMSLPMRGNGTKNFSFDKLRQSASSTSLKQHSLTVEYTSNPAWYAVQALPYLMEYPYDCAEQTWNRYYANSLASFIANSAPRIRQVFEQWKNTDTAALLSNLQKNPELKSILLEETPWVLAAKTEAQQKQNIALLFDMLRMSGELNSSYEKMKQLQSSNGGFVWFKGGPDDRYMTQYIVTGIGHLIKLKGIAAGQEAKLKQVLNTAIPYLDRKIKEDYDNLVKYKTDLAKYVPDYSVIQYFYMRSFFPDYKIPAGSQKAYTYFKSRLPQNWTGRNKYMQGMTALTLHRMGDIKTPAAILKSLKETSINNEELGMYWKDANRGWWWYEAPIERQSLLIEAFSEISKDTKTVDDLRTWLLKNKQTNSWESTKATAEACYALLLQGSNWLTQEPQVSIQLGSAIVRSTDTQQEAGTGYFSKTFQPADIKPEMGNIAVTVSSAGNNTSATWGGVYWQYFEDLDKITGAATPLQLQKKLFVETNSDRGPVLTPVKDGDKLKTGDKIRVRIELRADRDMEYMHLKDMRASALEPVNVLSSYKWQDGLGYYESTRDAATHFFFDKLRKGTYVFEYSLFVTHSGNFSNGISTIQSMYAPEFSAHSEGVRITVQ